jgi:periplasmic protein CpxP/Spy
VFLSGKANFKALQTKAKESRQQMFNSIKWKSSLRLWAGAMALMLPSSFALTQDAPPMAMHGPMHGDMMGGHDLRFLSHYLDLSEAQKTQVKQLFVAQKSTFEPLMEQEHQGHLQMTQLVQSGSFDETKAQTIAVSLSQTEVQMMVQKAKLDAQIFQLLTPEQKTKMTQLTTEREHFAEHMQRLQQNDQPQPPNN